ncbi:hypothetical protein KCU83_g43, partial [Aureobasidium melanogenum]
MVAFFLSLVLELVLQIEWFAVLLSVLTFACSTSSVKKGAKRGRCVKGIGLSEGPSWAAPGLSCGDSGISLRPASGREATSALGGAVAAGLSILRLFVGGCMLPLDKGSLSAVWGSLVLLDIWHFGRRYQAALMARDSSRIQNKASSQAKLLEVENELYVSAARKQVLCWLESSKSMNDIKVQACLITAKTIRSEIQIEHDTRRYALLP